MISSSGASSKPSLRLNTLQILDRLTTWLMDHAEGNRAFGQTAENIRTGRGQVKGGDCQTKPEWEPCWILGKRYRLSRIWGSLCSPQVNKQGPIKRSGLTTGRNAQHDWGYLLKIGGTACPMH